MSVILFNESEIDEITGQVLTVSEVFTAIDNLEHFNNYSKYSKSIENADITKIKKDYIGRAFWYYLVANRAAYSLQYREAIDLSESTEKPVIEKTITTKEELKTLSDNLHSIRYNMATNDGNVFLQDAWQNVLNTIIDTIDTKLNNTPEDPKPEEETAPRLNATDTAKAIRKELKAIGINNKMVSVTSEYFSMGSAVRVSIKSLSIDKKAVKEIAEKYEDISRDEYTGEILSGGNMYITISYDITLTAEERAAGRELTKKMIKKYNVNSIDTIFNTLRENEIENNKLIETYISDNYTVLKMYIAELNQVTA